MMGLIKNDAQCMVFGSCGHLVHVSGHDLPLEPSLKVARHSPTGFSWGYGGSGPSQLALAMMLEATGDQFRALSLYQLFKNEVVCRLPFGGEWRLSGR